MSHVKLPVYPPDSAEELLNEIRDRVIKYTRNMSGPEAGAIHNIFAIGFQTLTEMDFQQRHYSKVYTILKAKKEDA